MLDLAVGTSSSIISVFELGIERIQAEMFFSTTR